MGSVWSRLGSKVTVIEYADRILPGMDTEVSSSFQKILIKQGFDFKLSTALRSVNKEGDSLSVSVENKGQTMNIDCDKVLISTGRRPYTFGLNLEELGVKLDDKGFIITDNHFKTSIDNIYAVGDCKLGPMLAHKASEEGTAVAEIIDGQAGHVNYSAIPSVIYTAPEVASVGKTEDEIKAEGVTYKVGKFPFTANAKAKVMNDTGGFVKILSDNKLIRPSGRSFDELREIEFIPNFISHAEGSCFVKYGETHVLCTASVEERVPIFLKNSGKGWVTAEYGMLPRSTHTRSGREASRGKQSGRTLEIQRLIGRSLRSIIDLKALGERQIIIDCDVIQADGGTRTASITGGWIALSCAVKKLLQINKLKSNPIIGQICAVSCGIWNGFSVLDLDYSEDSSAEVDLSLIHI